MPQDFSLPKPLEGRTIPPGRRLSGKSLARQFECSGFGFDLAVGGAVPETSTWAMMLIGFAGLGFAGYRSSRAAPRAV
jgi:hypothetical protein